MKNNSNSILSEYSHTNKSKYNKTLNCIIVERNDYYVLITGNNTQIDITFCVKGNKESNNELIEVLNKDIFKKVYLEGYQVRISLPIEDCRATVENINLLIDNFISTAKENEYVNCDDNGYIGETVCIKFNDKYGFYCKESEADLKKKIVAEKEEYKAVKENYGKGMITSLIISFIVSVLVYFVASKCNFATCFIFLIFIGISELIAYNALNKKITAKAVVSLLIITVLENFLCFKFIAATNLYKDLFEHGHNFKFYFDNSEAMYSMLKMSGKYYFTLGASLFINCAIIIIVTFSKRMSISKKQRIYKV